MLTTIPRLPLMTGTTPLQRLSGLGHRYGADIWAKRDDLAGPAGGGNKVRKLEYLVPEARSLGATWLLTVGAVQSNHARMTAAVASMVGLRCLLVLEGAPPASPVGNLLLDRVFGAQTVFCPPGEGAARMAAEASRLREQGEVPYVIPVGGSTPLGAVGYVRGMRELAAQLHDLDLEPELIVSATGSAGTQAGMVLGAHLFCPGIRVLGISVSRTKPEAERLVSDMMVGAAGLLGVGPPPRDRVRVDDRFVGPGYGIPTPEGVAALRETARSEGVLLDPVYTAKAMAGLLAALAEARGPVLFWHTGGVQSLSAHPFLGEEEA